ncbi:hypothetical protein EDB81DRAFT_54390 [Dactylonectria macrodidyma]|uniref:Uncharacterized protein n=1 Tax=Dactylonectria macrodidyma TaxID=307937 RepID=A0A9P9EM60_9HYPO|nr:hypothetical protein EDB81DRAFT_54390 [Dactylonectria macrodidyma]
MRRVGLRALKWPLDSKVSGIVSNLDRHRLPYYVCKSTKQQSCSTSVRGSKPSRSNPEGDISIARTPCFIVPFDRDSSTLVPAHLL